MKKQLLRTYNKPITSKFCLKPTNILKYSTQKPPSDSSFDFGNLTKQLKEVSKFYWDGCKAQVEDFKKANKLRREISYRLFRRANRKELLFLNQAYYDLLKFIPFIVVFMLPGATLIIPVIAYLFPIVLPSKLQPKDYQKNIRESQVKFRETERKEFIQKLMEFMKVDSPLKEIINNVEKLKDEDKESRTTDFPLDLMEKIDDLTDDFSEEFKLKNLPGPILTSLCKIHLLPTFPWTISFMPKSTKIRYLKYHMAQLRKDDAMISSSDQYFSSSLDSNEIKDALHKRGFDTRGYSYKTLTQVMENWLESNSKPNSLLLFIGPILWK
eukprot:gene640-8143_t